MAMFMENDGAFETDVNDSSTTSELGHRKPCGRRRYLAVGGAVFIFSAALVAVWAFQGSSDVTSSKQRSLLYTICPDGQMPNDCNLCNPDADGKLPTGCSEPTHSCACSDSAGTVPVGCNKMCKQTKTFYNCYYGYDGVTKTTTDSPMPDHTGGFVSCGSQFLDSMYLSMFGGLLESDQ
eukprot:TRINITY_DN4684_c0_g1_i1.p1 TRINITY_DN4684_c0_g1~~TRINITY_DN4684_c0_g1_i1.p1  ORF type:complete len:179 (-),score=21.59 TRINITY_DN4684_c0_g1_i1:146-682(-)